MSVIEGKAAALMFPVSAADATGLRGIARYASLTTIQNISIPSELRGRFIRFASVGCNTRVSVSVGAHALVYATTANLGTGSAASGATVASGGYIEGVIPNDCTHLNFISDAASQTVEIYCTEVAVLSKASVK